MRSLKELLDMEGKTVFFTGGAGYLGSSMCESLAELRANIVVASRDEEKCKMFAEKLKKKYNINSMGTYVDITKIKTIEKALSLIKKEFGYIDVLINSAWSGKKNNFESITKEDWLYDIDVCLNGVFYTIKSAFPHLRKTEGVILNIASMYGHIAPDYRIYKGTDHVNPPSYGAGKAGVIQLTKYLASFLSPYRIRVNSISPGPFPFPETQDKNREFIKKLERKNMLGRIGKPEDLKGVVALLCSDASSYITGQNICIDGGWAAW